MKISKNIKAVLFLTATLQGFCMSNSHAGMLFVLEGIDGSGKTTLIKKLDLLLEQANIAHMVTKEPGATELGQQIRNMVLQKTAPTCPLAQLLLFAADRAQHFNEVIAPKLEQGNVIISDRMSDSSLAYQGYFKGLDLEMIKTINAWCMQSITPDTVFYLRIEAKDAIDRIKANRAVSDKFEEEVIDRMQTLIDGFDAIFATKPNGIIIDAMQDQDMIAHQIFEIILAKQKEKQGLSRVQSEMVESVHARN